LARHKFLSIQELFKNGISVPESRYVSNRSNFERAVSELGGFPLVVKKPVGRQGSGVSLMVSRERPSPFLQECFGTGKGLLVQRFIPTDERRDIRVMVLGDKIIGAVSLRPRKGDFRANVHLNARAEEIRLSEKMSDMALDATRALGLDISGVDMIEEKNGALRVMDVNYSPGFRGMEKCIRKDVAIEIIKYMTKLI
jgi:ribosomal protein S6--L-glutamate ligase